MRVGEGRPERVRVAPLVPALRGPVRPLGHRHEVEERAPAQRVGHDMAAGQDVHDRLGRRAMVGADEGAPRGLSGVAWRHRAVQHPAGDRADPIGSDHEVGRHPAPILQLDHGPALGRAELGHRAAEPDRDAGVPARLGEQAEEVGAVHQAPVGPVGRRQDQPGEAPPRAARSQHHGLGALARGLQSGAEAQGAEHAVPIRADLDAGTDLAQRRGPLQDAHPRAAARQAQRRGEAPDAAPHHGDLPALVRAGGAVARHPPRSRLSRRGGRARAARGAPAPPGSWWRWAGRPAA